MSGWGGKHHPRIILRVLCVLGLKGQCPKHAPKLAGLKVSYKAKAKTGARKESLNSTWVWRKRHVGGPSASMVLGIWCQGEP